jgi:4-amino-4-deoxy-L-arabinose transferase-like glycosyltransferase
MSEPDRLISGSAIERALDRYLPPFLLLAGVLGTIPVVRALYVADLNWCYLYLSPDSYDWINNGLYWAGAPVRPDFRPPGLPFIIAILVRLNLLPWLPILSFVVLGLTALVLYRLLREAFPASVAALAAWVFYSNDFSQDVAKYVLADVWVTPFLVLAALLFCRAARHPGLYIPFGLTLGLGFLFHYAAVPAVAGFAVAVEIWRRGDLRQRSLWIGAALGSVIAVSWMLVRWLEYRWHPDFPRHGVEALLGWTPRNVLFYLLTGTALLGVALLPLYAIGLLRLAQGRRPGDLNFRLAVLSPLAGLGIFFGFFYDWTDKRLLFYLFPFVVAVLAGGIDAVLRYSRGPSLLRAVTMAYLVGAIAWNQIHYPTYGLRYLALTPRDFLKLEYVEGVKGKATLRFEGASIVRLHRRVRDAFRWGLFDISSRAVDCNLSDPGYESLAALRAALNERLGRGAAVGLDPLPGWPPDYWSSLNRASNALERPIVRPDLAECRITAREVAGTKTLLTVGPYVVVCRP